jgi:SAM-dependent methyltransferase
MPLKPFKFKQFYKIFKDKKFKMLDIGCGNHSPSITKHWFPKCEYYGLDNNKYYSNDENDLKQIKEFYDIDLLSLDFSKVPDNYFDVIMLAHVIEHLSNGDLVIEDLIKKVKPGGYIYIEYPAKKSTRFPSKIGSLNFYDDPTHCRLYDISEISNILKKKKTEILKSGTRREFFRIILFPLIAIRCKIKLGYVPGITYWDIYGFAEYVFARKLDSLEIISN